MSEKELTDEDKADANRLKKVLMSSGMTQEEVGAALGITQGMVGHFVNGRRKIHLDAAIEFSILFKVPVYEFSPQSQKRINSAYNSPIDGNMSGVIELLRNIDPGDVGLALDLLQSVVKRKIKDVQVKN